MYKLLLCLRYLRTRYIALASVISVMLGVATMIVVNSVMSGFSHEMKTRLHGILGDVSLEAWSASGFSDPEWHMQRIRNVLGEDVEAMTPLCATAGILNYRSGGTWQTHEVIIVGIDENTKGDVGDFSKYLQHPANREKLSFMLRDKGYDQYDHQVELSQAGILGKIITWCARVGGRDTEKNPLFHKEIRRRVQMEKAGWEHRRDRYLPIYAEVERFDYTLPPPSGEMSGTEHLESSLDIQPPPDLGAPENPSSGDTPFVIPQDETSEDIPQDIFTIERPQEYDPSRQQHAGAVVGMGISLVRVKEDDYMKILPGDDIKLTFASSGTPPTATTANFTCVDLYESKMSEYDGRFVFVPLASLQELRGMADPSDPRRNKVNQIQMKLRPGVDPVEAREKLKKIFDPMMYDVRAWQDHQVALLQAVEVETRMLNVLLFMIIAVSGFGILAIFYTIVVEKTRDIGVLKALGASSSGVMSIFLMYGLGLGIVGAGMGCVVGLLFVWNINEIADLISWVLGFPVFNPDVYFFYEIPYDVNVETVAWIVGGALIIAVLASVFPAWRASRLQPVDSLRYE